MVCALIAIALIGEAPVPQDHGFVMAVERWVLDITRPQSLEELFGEETAVFFEMLSCNKYACRKFACKILGDEKYYKQVAIGTMLKDVQAASLCESLLTKWICPLCNGKGKTVIYSEWGSYYSYCERCLGNGR